MRSTLAGLLVASCAGCTAGSDLIIEVSSEIEPLQSLALAVLGPEGGTLTEREIRGDGDSVPLPNRIELAKNGRADLIELRLWGLATTLGRPSRR